MRRVCWRRRCGRRVSVGFGVDGELVVGGEGKREGKGEKKGENQLNVDGVWVLGGASSGFVGTTRVKNILATGRDPG